jgi:MFS family permease
MLIVFMFLIGATGSASLTNVAATVVDLFGDINGNGQAMALFVFSAELGPGIGSPIGAWIAGNSSLGLKWIFLINVIIGAGFTIVLCFIPETLPRLVIARRGAQLGRNGPVHPEDIVTLTAGIRVTAEIKFISTMAFKFLYQE